MTGRRFLAPALLLAIGCAHASPEIAGSAPAGGDALTCAQALLAERGYELRELLEGALEGELRRAQAPVGAVRELIQVSVTDPPEGTPELRVRIRALDYGPADHGLPIHRQSVSETRPSEQAAADGALLLASCGRYPPRDFGAEG
jgi:hypothetical protein